VTAAGAACVEALDRARAALGCARDLADLAGAEGHLAGAVREAGRTLRKRVLPDEVVERLLADRTITHLVFECSPLLNGIPFDCAFLANDFVGFQYATGKHLWHPAQGDRAPRARTLPYCGASVIDPGGLLAPDVGAEFLAFKNAWQSGPANGKIDLSRAWVSRPIAVPQVCQRLREAEFLNLLGHHRYDATAPEASGLVLAKEPESIFAARDLLEAVRPGDSAPLLLVSISCDSGITQGWEEDWPGCPRVYGLVDAAQRRGVRHYVGTLIEVPEPRSVRLLPPLYEALASGWTVGEAFRRARVAFRDPQRRGDPTDGGTVLGLAFVLYGQPGMAYVCGAGHAAEGVLPRLCEHPVDGGYCLRTICPEDTGWQQARCPAHAVGPAQRCSAGHAVGSALELFSCRVAGCRNTLCQDCSGHGLGFCWAHGCHEGHEIVGGPAGRKICSNPCNRHPQESRSVCPLDRGWIRGLCGECYDAQAGR